MGPQLNNQTSDSEMQVQCQQYLKNVRLDEGETVVSSMVFYGDI